MKVRKAVIPAAGLGTRLLPISKSVPKELLPILDKPLIQYVIEEAVEAGIEQVIIVTAPGKESLEGYFQRDPELENLLAEKGSLDRLDGVNRVISAVELRYVNQEQPLGLGHAVLTARPLVGDEPILVMLPDDIILGEEGSARQMLRTFDRLQASVIAVEQVPWEEVQSYGVVKARKVEKGLYEVEGVVEKPSPKEAPSNMGIVGRYVLTPEIFPCLERTAPGAKGEIQLTDGIALLLESQRVYAYQFEGIRYDGGTPLGILRASLEMALQRDDLRQGALEILRQLDPDLLSEITR